MCTTFHAETINQLFGALVVRESSICFPVFSFSFSLVKSFVHRLRTRAEIDRHLKAFTFLITLGGVWHTEAAIHVVNKAFFIIDKRESLLYYYNYYSNYFLL